MDCEKESLPEAENLHGVIVPGGFGERGVEGKIETIKYCRENNVPFLGLCYGMQLAVVEFARNVCGLKNANTAEIKPKVKHNVIDILDEQKGVKDMGGTMRLGSYGAKLKKNSQICRIYNGKDVVSERHRHRFEVNPDYHESLEENGLVISGRSVKNKDIAEFIEYPENDFFVATQGHPELKSTVEKPAPLFVGFLKAVK